MEQGLRHGEVKKTGEDDGDREESEVVVKFMADVTGARMRVVPILRMAGVFEVHLGRSGYL